MTRSWLLALCLLVAACGRKALPVPPELVHPKPPGDIFATAVPTGVQLRWARPAQYTSGKRMHDLDGFVVERAQEGADGALEFAPVTTIHLEDRYRFQQERRVEWVDTAAVDGQRYFYRVMALTLDGYRSDPAGPVAIDYTRPGAPPKPAAGEKPRKTAPYTTTAP